MIIVISMMVKTIGQLHQGIYNGLYFVGAAVIIAYGLTVVSSVGAGAGAALAARAALMGALGGVAASIGTRHKQRKTEKALDEKEEQLQTQQKEIEGLNIEVALAKQREGKR